MDFAQSLDPWKCLVVQTGLSFLTSAFTSPTYNLPISLFGHYTIENQEAVQSLQIFITLLAASFIFDIVYMTRHEMNGFIKFLTILNQLVKIPTVFSSLMTLRQRGAQFTGLGNFRGGDLSGPTVWSVPGSFPSGGREGYQSVDEEGPFERPHAPVKANKPPVPAAPPTASTTPQPAQSPAPGAYQSV